MINLLPLKDKIKAKKEYLRRLFLVFGVLSLFSALGAVALLLPLSYLVSVQKKGYERQAAFLEKQLDLSDSAEVIPAVKDLNSKIALLKKNRENSPSVAEIIRKIILNKNGGISLRAFSYDGNFQKEYAGRISAAGFSATRENLLDFMSALKGEDFFASVELPPANLLKEKNIEFSVIIKINKNENKI
ncbi:MAG: hypothetical protein GXP44_00955 [bacterium]|nr:hypothetical protein [bacterium]